MSKKKWGHLPYLEGLRPEPGWRTDFAVLTTYSADLVAVVATLLALAGLDDERGSGSKVDVANAIEALRDRTRILVQAGRITAPTKTPKILCILDRFIREVAMDETEGSWHPKAGLIQMTAEDGNAVQWRLWVGSRNLTRDTSWDVGLVLVGHPESVGRLIPGVAELGRELVARADLKDVRHTSVYKQLQSVHWEMPTGCTVEDVQLLLRSERALPEAPSGIRKLTVVSPFLDGTMVNHFGRWGDEHTRRVLVSTLPELGKLNAQASRPLAAYDDVLYLEAPSSEVDRFAPLDEEPDVGSEDERPDARGLHAKLIYAEDQGGRSLWLGSANVTQRGWRGPNTEIVARLSVGADAGAGLDAFLDEIGRIADLESIKPPESDDLNERLEEAHRKIAARWRVVQRIRDERPLLEATQLPHPDEPNAELWVGLLAQSLTRWPRGATSLQLPPVSLAETTELVHCEVRLEGKSIGWLQRTPLDPPPGASRDHRALARYLDPRTFLLWIRSILTSDALSDGGGDWDNEPPRHPPPPRSAGPEWWAPTLEDVLKAWSRDPGTVREVDRKVRRYLAIMEQEPPEGQAEEEREIFEQFRSIWDVLRSQLVERTP